MITLPPSELKTAAYELKVRRINFNFPPDIDRYWAGGSPFKTHLLNSFHVFLPRLEQWIVRSIRRASHQISDPGLKQNIKAFAQQEAQHAAQHRRFWQHLERQGYQLDQFVQLETQLLEALQQRSLKLNIAAIAGFEHVTTLIATLLLQDDFLTDCEPTMHAMLQWHVEEEIEHRCLAFDTMQALQTPYWMRVMGLAIGYGLAAGLLNFGLLMLLYQDRRLHHLSSLKGIIEFWITRQKALFRGLWKAMQYLSPYFHPSQLSGVE